MKKIGVAVIGPGAGKNGFGLGAYIIQEVTQHANATLLAVGGTTKESIQRSLSAENKEVAIYTTHNMEALFVRSDIDLVIISSPAISHLECIRLGINHNKHLLVEKPIVELGGNEDSTRLAEMKTLFATAKSKNLFLSTNCQRAFIPCFLGLEKVKESVVVEMGIGKKQTAISREDFLPLTISHPISILVKLGLIKVEAYHIESIASHSVDFENFIQFNFAYNKVKGAVILKQYDTDCAADINLMVDDAPPTRAVAERVKEHYHTKYETYNGNVYGKDLLSNAIQLMIDAVSEAGVEPVINNMESEAIFRIQEFFYTAYLNQANR